jgi:hypothetical protein
MIPVSTKKGWMQPTRSGVDRTALERARIMPSTACFDPEYWGASPIPIQEATEPIKMRALRGSEELGVGLRLR